MNAQVLGISVDHIPCLKAWAESLNGIEYPLLSDFWPHGAVAQLYGVFRSDGRSERAIFVIDRWGCIRYIDIHDIDHQPANDEVRQVLRRIDPQAAAKEREQRAVAEFSPPQGGIVLYCTSWCPDCKRVRRWLEERGMQYAEYDIDVEPGAAARVKGWANGNRTTPTIDVDGRVIVGYKLDQLEQAVKAWQQERQTE